MRSISAIVLGSGSVGPDARADSLPAGTSVTASVIFLAVPAAAASLPPFTAERCFRTVFIASIGAPQVTSARCTACTSSNCISPQSGSSTNADPPPDIRKITTVPSSQLSISRKMASADFQLSALGTGCPPTKYSMPGTRRSGATGATTIPESRVPGGRMHSSPVTIAWAALPIATTYTFAIWERSMAPSGRISRDPSRSNFLSITRGISMDASVCRKIRRAISFPVAINAPPAVSRLLQHRGIHHVRRHLPME